MGNRRRSFEEISLVGDEPNKNKRTKWILIALAVMVVIAGITVGSVFYTRSREAKKHSCADTASRIIEAALSDSSLVYSRLGYLCHVFGNRLTGSSTLEAALHWSLEEMRRDNLSNVHGEPVAVSSWIRGNESVQMLSPFNRNLAMLGLGGSINTSAEGITGRVIVVSNYTDLDSKSSLIPGNIVLFNVPFTTYGATVQYRSGGADRASKYNATAVLVRSVTPYSLYTPHTGSMGYSGNVPKIPAAAITVEDAELIQGLYDMNISVTVTLYMESHFLPGGATSQNIMGEITGSLYPNKVISIGGHTDSWDVGQGAMDDGGGVLVSWEAVRLLKTLGLTPKRTVRFVGWVNEENGGAGGVAYADMHKNETHILALESDLGATTPQGIAVTGEPKAVDMLRGITALLGPINADRLDLGGGGADITPLGPLGATLSSLTTDSTRYFWFHHTNADTFDKMDDMQLRKCVATMAVVSYCTADAEEDLPPNLTGSTGEE